MTQPTYQQALAELEAIVASLQKDDCDVDTLTDKTRRAVELLHFCRERLTATSDELETILKTLQSPDQSPTNK